VNRPFFAFAVTCLALTWAPSIDAQSRWQVRVEQRFALDDGLADPIKDLRDFAVGRDGRLYVLENTVKQVHVYLPTGRYSKSFARTGSGPGELRDANGIIAGPDGTLWINDHGNGRITNYTADGAFLRQMLSQALGYRFRWSGFISPEGVLHDELFSSRPREAAPPLHVLQRRRLDGTVLDTVTVESCPGDKERKTAFAAVSKDRRRFMQIPFLQQRLSAIDPRGAVWCNIGTAYSILRLDIRSGATLAKAERPVSRYPVPEKMRDSAIAAIRSAVAGYESSDVDLSLVPNEFPFFQALIVDDRGRLWARRQTDTARTEFDVFDETGRFLATATLSARTSAYGRVLIRGDDLYAVALDDDDIANVVRARIVVGAR